MCQPQPGSARLECHSMGILHGTAPAGLRIMYWKTGGLPKKDGPVARMAHVSMGWVSGRTRFPGNQLKNMFTYTIHWSGLDTLP